MPCRFRFRCFTASLAEKTVKKEEAHTHTRAHTGRSRGGIGGDENEIQSGRA